MRANQVVFVHPGEEGWAPIFRLAELAAGYLDAEMTAGELVPPGLASKLFALSGRRRRRPVADICLFIAAAPRDLVGVLAVPGWRSRYRTLACLVVDSFWTDEIPRTVRHSRLFDHYFITSREDLGAWRAQVGDRVSWFPWGSDVLSVEHVSLERPTDLLRVGRQPDAWDDDSANAGALQASGLAYQPRPPKGRTWQENRGILARAYDSAKHVLAFTNVAHRNFYTHHERQYLTARWTDSLAHGATVAGITPHEPSIDELLWPGATLEFGSAERAAGITALVSACRDWRAEHALRNHQQALARLDWRWRLQHLVRTLSLASPGLDADLARLRARIGPAASVPSFTDAPAGRAITAREG